MPREFPRTRRVGEQMRRDLSALIREEVGDPRMAMVSITAVEVTRDLAYSKIFITIIGDPADRLDMVTTLNEVAPMLRRELARCMRIRTVPRLEFIYDETVERGARLDQLISKTVAADSAKYQEDGGDDDGDSDS